jgi:hypothetical protein
MFPTYNYLCYLLLKVPQIISILNKNMSTWPSASKYSLPLELTDYLHKLLNHTKGKHNA